MTQKWTHRYEFKPGRWVFAPTKEARATGLGIKHAIAERWKPPSFYFHLRAGGHVAAIRSHSSHQFFYRADLEDFFGRVNRSRVTRCLKKWFSYADARAMASESVVKRPMEEAFVLPYGFVQSPILASLALDRSKLGSHLRSLGGRDDIAVSVYVDDIIVSSNDENTLCGVAVRLAQVAEEALFPLSASKQEGPASKITAFNIELSKDKLRLTEARLAKLRDAYVASESSYRRAGILGYVRSVDPDQELGW